MKNNKVIFNRRHINCRDSEILKVYIVFGWDTMDINANTGAPWTRPWSMSTLPRQCFPTVTIVISLAVESSIIFHHENGLRPPGLEIMCLEGSVILSSSGGIQVYSIYIGCSLPQQGVYTLKGLAHGFRRFSYCVFATI